ncbi:MAG: MoaD/ThiS family protein [Thermodesulfobacteriota bacterium]
MISVQVELWLWLSNELREDFDYLSPMRCGRREEVSEGMTIGQLLANLAKRYSPLANKVYNLGEDKLYPYLVINYNERVISPYVVYDQPLKEGDKITILPMYVGG